MRTDNPKRPDDLDAPIHADLRQVIYALSDTLDLVGVDDLAHGKRVAIMVAECGRHGGLERHEITFLFDAALLRDIGVSSTQVHDRLLREFDWAGAHEHCEQGASLLREIRPLSALADPIRFHHTRWDHLETLELPTHTKEQANLIFLADRVNMLACHYYLDRPTLLRQAIAIRENITARANTYFSPRLVVDFLAASASEAFWLNLELRSVHAYLGQMLKENPPIDTPVRELKHLARIFARIVDGKSSYMNGHSQGVSRVARHLAARLGMPAEMQDKMEIAGLLHDLGKLRIPDEIIEKPGPLDEFERHIMKTHSYETFQILRRVVGFDEILEWIAYELDKPNRSRQLFRQQNLSRQAHIMRVADVFQAMLQDRPFRKALEPAQVRTFLDEMVSRGQLDGDIVADLLADLPAAMAAALP